jgi:hypothetical protein
MKVIVSNPGNLPTMSYKELEDFQGDLKTLSDDALEKLKHSILKHGIFVPKFVWKGHILDGHQTCKALTELEAEGYEIPDLPVVNVEADSLQDAAEKLLQINSRYGAINPGTDFFDRLEMPDFDLSEIEIPELAFFESERETFPPDDFKEYDENIETAYHCPKCGYEWSGKPK